VDSPEILKSNEIPFVNPEIVSLKIFICFKIEVNLSKVHSKLTEKFESQKNSPGDFLVQMDFLLSSDRKYVFKVCGKVNRMWITFQMELSGLSFQTGPGKTTERLFSTGAEL
jgi:hypothetical protein